MEERIPFDIKYRPEIEVGKYLVVTRDNHSARIICWDAKLRYPIIFLFLSRDGNKENILNCHPDGRFISSEYRSDNDLFLVPNPDYKEPTAEPSVSAEPSVDWDAFRREAAKDILCALITSDMGGSAEDKSRWSIDAVDELIKQLKEGKK